jgi:hypothetical protein
MSRCPRPVRTFESHGTPVMVRGGMPQRAGSHDLGAQRNLRPSHPRPAPPYRAPWVPVLAGDRQLQAWLNKEQENETQPPLLGPGTSMSSAPAAGDEPGIDSSERRQATLITRCPLALLPPVKALCGAGAARGSGRTCSS